MSSLAPQLPPRFVGLDVHKHSIMVAAVDKEQQLLLRPRRFAIPEFLDWAAQHLTRSDTVVLEASTNAWPLYDALQPLVGSVIVAHAGKLPQIAAARVKTDPGDALKLAKLLAANLVPAVWVPPPEVRTLRTLVAHRQRLIRQRTQLRNHLHAILHTYYLSAPRARPLCLPPASLVAVSAGATR